MEPLYGKYWPKGVPRTFTLPRTTLYYNLEVSAIRYPEKTAISYYGSSLSYGRLKSEVDALAGYLQRQCGVKKGDRVLLYMQNSPQFIIAYYAVLRADAVLVPANPMNLTGEMKHYIEDAGVAVAICGIELFPRLEPLMGPGGLEEVIVADYGDYVTEPTDLPIPDFIRNAPRNRILRGPGDGRKRWRPTANPAPIWLAPKIWRPFAIPPARPEGQRVVCIRTSVSWPRPQASTSGKAPPARRSSSASCLFFTSPACRS